MKTRRSFLQALGIFSCATLLPTAVFARTDEELFSETRLLMGTFVNITVRHPHKAIAEKAMHEAFGEIERLENLFSRHKESSVTKLNREKELYNAPQELLQVAMFSQQIEKSTQGYFNPAVLPVLERMEQDSATGTMGANLREYMQFVQPNTLKVNGKNIALQANARITLDGIAKGYIVDKSLAVLEKYNIAHCLINAGGDIRAKGLKSDSIFGDKAWVVALEDPQKQGLYPGMIALQNKAIATSGSYEKNFGNGKHHLIIPHIIPPAKNTVHVQNEISLSPNIKSVSVLADSAMEADALATALACMPISEALAFVEARPSLACAIIGEDNRVLTSKTWSFIS